MNPLNSPLLNLNIEYNTIIVVIIQNNMSWTYVIQSFVLKDFRKTLNRSKISPIKKPLNIKIANKYAWFSNKSPYLKIFPIKEEEFFLSKFLSE